MYQVADFLAKNKDVQQDQLFEIMHNSTNDFVRAIASLQDTTESIYGTIGRAGPDGTLKGSKGRPLVADAFRQQLSALVDLLSATRPWYVRCIKPNLSKSPRNYDVAQVHTQLKYLGMLDIIRIRREGFPAHFNFAVFVARFRCLLVVSKSHHSVHLKPNSTSVRDLLNRIKIDPRQWQIGHSKVFLKALVAEELEERRSAIRDRAAVSLQSNWRRLFAHRLFSLLRTSAIIIQRSFRATRARLLFQRQRRAAITIQAYVRGMFAREVARALRNMRQLEAEQAIKRQPTVEEEEEEEEMREACQGLQQLGFENGGAGGGFIYGKRSSTPDELDLLERQLTEEGGSPLPPPPPPEVPNYEEIDNFASEFEVELTTTTHPSDPNNNTLNEETSEDSGTEEPKRKVSTGNAQSISQQFEQLIQKAELAANSLDKLQVAASPARTRPSQGGKSGKYRNSTTSLADQLKAIINVEESADSGTSGIDTGNSVSPSLYSMDSAVSEASEHHSSASDGAGTSASDTLMLAAINEDVPKGDQSAVNDCDRSSIASSSILDNRTSTSDTTTGTREDCMSIMSGTSGATGTSGDFEAVSASPSFQAATMAPPPTPQAQLMAQQQMIYGARAAGLQQTYLSTSASLGQMTQLGGNYQIINNQLVPIPQQASPVQTQAQAPPSKFISKQIEAHNNPQADLGGGPLDGPIPEKSFELIDYVARYCNNHPRDAYGSSVVLGGASGGSTGKDRTLTRKRKPLTAADTAGNNNPEAHLTFSEMITWTSSTSIPTSHVHLHDPQNVVLCKLLGSSCNCLLANFLLSLSLN